MNAPFAVTGTRADKDRHADCTTCCKRRQATPGACALRQSRSLFSSLLGLAVFLIALLIRTADMPVILLGRMQAADRGARLAAQSALTMFLVLTGLRLVVFVEPLTAWWSGGDVLRGDRRPAYPAAGSTFALVFVMAFLAVRGSFARAPLAVVDGAVIAAASVIFLVRSVWRRDLLERFLAAKQRRATAASGAGHPLWMPGRAGPVRFAEV